MKTILLMLLGMSVASAQTPGGLILPQLPPPPPQLDLSKAPKLVTLPRIDQILDRSCTRDEDAYMDRTIDFFAQDPVTGYWSAEVWARSYCGPDELYQGCAILTVDPSGTVWTLKQRWREKLDRDHLHLSGSGNCIKNEGPDDHRVFIHSGAVKANE